MKNKNIIILGFALFFGIINLSFFIKKNEIRTIDIPKAVNTDDLIKHFVNIYKENVTFKIYPENQSLKQGMEFQIILISENFDLNLLKYEEYLKDLNGLQIVGNPIKTYNGIVLKFKLKNYTNSNFKARIDYSKNLPSFLPGEISEKIKSELKSLNIDITKKISVEVAFSINILKDNNAFEDTKIK